VVRELLCGNEASATKALEYVNRRKAEALKGVNA
jgi:hypothetical protein